MTLHIVDSRVRATGRIIEFIEVDIEDDDGTLHKRDVIRHPGGVGVVPFTGEDVFLVRQYRVAMDAPVLEIPAGKLEPGEDVGLAASRELKEELGMTGRLRSIGSLLVSPGYTDERIHLYVAEDIVAGTRQPDGAEEHEAEIVQIPLRRALSMVEDGQIVDAKSQIALLRLERSLS